MELDEKLRRFFAEVRKKDGSDYDPDSLRVMIASLDRQQSQSTRLKGKARFLRERGCKPNQLRVTKRGGSWYILVNFEFFEH